MTFQFLCPQGHLLQGEEEHMGMQCQCPQCGTAFIIPTIEGAAQPSGSTSHVSEIDLDLLPQGAEDLIEPAPRASAGGRAPNPFDPDETSGPDDDDATGVGELAIGELGKTIHDEALYHIPCPNGHELETPESMLGQRAMCPHCGVEFRLKREKSSEFRQKQEILERKQARFWFQLAVMVATFVVLVLLVMIGIMALSS